MTLIDEFENLEIDEDKEEEQIKDVDQNEDVFLNQIANNEINQLKNNSFPKGLMTLKDLFDNNYVAKFPGVVPSGIEVEDLNIGTAENTKLINIYKTLCDKEKKKYLDLFKKYIDVFSWKYECISYSTYYQLRYMMHQLFNILYL